MNEHEWYCPAKEEVIDEGLCWEYCFVNNGGPTDTAAEIATWRDVTRKFKNIEDFHRICDTCIHCQWSR